MPGARRPPAFLPVPAKAHRLHGSTVALFETDLHERAVADRSNDGLCRAAERPRPNLARRTDQTPKRTLGTLRARLLSFGIDPCACVLVAGFARAQRRAGCSRTLVGRVVRELGDTARDPELRRVICYHDGVVCPHLQVLAAGGDCVARRMDRGGRHGVAVCGGKLLIGLYIGRSGVASGFGAAGSFVVLLVWVYYATQIFLLGAEFTWVYAHEHGSRQGQPRPGATDA